MIMIMKLIMKLVPLTSLAGLQMRAATFKPCRGVVQAARVLQHGHKGGIVAKCDMHFARHRDVVAKIIPK